MIKYERSNELHAANPSNKQGKHPECLGDLLQFLRQAEPFIDDDLYRIYDRIRLLRQEIVSASRSNFILERELDTIDEKIRLLIRNQISLQDVINSVQVFERRTTGLLDAKQRMAYEHVLYTLQNEPIHFAKLSRVITAGQIQSFVQTVVFDFYGDQYDTRDERLLLSLFGHVLHAEFASAPSMGSLLRANTAITNMLSAYSRRGMGLSILSEILSGPLQRITSEKELDLELNPVAIYRQLVEIDPTKFQDLASSKELSTEECLQIPEIQSLMSQRRSRLIIFASEILQRICDSVQTIPYGMRWICRKIKELAKEFFPQADNRKVGSLIGGYIYLRFFNPVIVTPDTVDIVRGKLSKKMRRNLILIAKLLQNLSNGLEFGEKESYMIPCNEFINNSREALQNYFNELVNVHDLETELVMDKWLERTSKREIQIQMSFNQLFFLHSLLEQHIDLLCDNNHPCLRKQIMQLGPAPQQLKPQDNLIVGIELRPSVTDLAIDAVTGFPRDRIPSTDIDPNQFFDHEDGHPLFQDSARLLMQFLASIPLNLTNYRYFKDLLQDALEYSERAGDIEISESVQNLSDAILTLKRLKLIRGNVQYNDPFDAFVGNVYQSVMFHTTHLKTVTERRDLVAKVAATIRNHHQYLESRLALYRQYLDNVRLGPAGSANSIAGHGSGRPPSVPACIKISQSELESSGLIIAMDPDVRKSIMKKASFMFSSTSNPNQFLMSVHCNKSRSPMTPILLDLEELLNMQSNNQIAINVPNMVLKVNLLINLLNARFLASRR